MFGIQNETSAVLSRCMWYILCVYSMVMLSIITNTPSSVLSVSYENTGLVVAELCGKNSVCVLFLSFVVSMIWLIKYLHEGCGRGGVNLHYFRDYTYKCVS